MDSHWSKKRPFPDTLSESYQLVIQIDILFFDILIIIKNSDGTYLERHQKILKLYIPDDDFRILNRSERL